MFHYRVGFCREACDITLYAMRAAGIPTATDFFAYSPEYQRSHYWTSLRDTTGQYIQFGFNEFEATRNERRTDGRKKGKVYRFCFGVQQEIFPGITYNNKIPGLFRNRFIKDVTEHYFGHNEVYVPIQSTGKKFIYLGVFSPEKWIPIDITPGGKATVKFHNIEPDIIYQPLFSDGKSHHAAGFPFIYIANNIHILKPDTTNMEEVALKRKMSLVNSFLLRLHKPIIGSKVEASQDPSFSTPDLLYLFKDTLTYNLYKLTPYKINKKYRYVRYLSPPGEEMELSEISFYKDSLCTESIPLKRINNIQPQKTLENITDGDILTYFSSEDTSCYVSYDMGKPVNIRKIMFSPRNDDNFIWPDDKYELLYQNGINGWVSLGTKTATGKEINFRAPKNALLWLRNKTKGREEQVFVYKNGKQYFTIDIDSSFL